jgi:hypothetical protein
MCLFINALLSVLFGLTQDVLCMAGYDILSLTRHDVQCMHMHGICYRTGYAYFSLTGNADIHNHLTYHKYGLLLKHNNVGTHCRIPAFSECGHHAQSNLGQYAQSDVKHVLYVFVY